MNNKASKHHDHQDESMKDVHHQRMQPTVVEPAGEEDTPSFNIDDFLGDIIGFPGKLMVMPVYVYFLFTSIDFFLFIITVE